jgi:hypothetical protein
MILHNAIDWIFLAILWILTPILRLIGLYALLASAAIVLLCGTGMAVRRRARAQAVNKPR